MDWPVSVTTVKTLLEVDSAKKAETKAEKTHHGKVGVEDKPARKEAKERKEAEEAKEKPEKSEEN